jgi:hypothetical protein
LIAAAAKTNEGRRFRNEQVTRGRPRIALIERPIDEAIEEHRCRPRQDHANHDQR